MTSAGSTRLLAVGLVSINLVAFGAAYWLATRDIMSEFTGEVRGRGARAADRAGWLKRSSLSKKIWLAPVEESSHVSLPLPLPRLNPVEAIGHGDDLERARADTTGRRTVGLAEHGSPR